MTQSKNYFKNKDHYLSFRSAWGKSMAKALAEDGYLTAEHHLLYAILRNRDWHAGFPPLCSPRGLAACLAPGGIPEPGIRVRWTIRRLFFYIKGAEEAREKDSSFIEKMSAKLSTVVLNQERKKGIVEEFLEPFGGTVTPEMMIEVYDDYFERLW